MAKSIGSLVGVRYGKLIVQSHWVENSGTNRARTICECLCDCGKTTFPRYGSLRDGDTKSCGCILPVLNIKLKTIHGHSRKNNKTPEYMTWNSMMARCNNPKNKGYSDYGGRGIKVCNRWHVFINFLADMGLRPSPDLSLERINNNKGYSKANCKWATRSEQQKNKRSFRRVR